MQLAVESPFVSKDWLDPWWRLNNLYELIDDDGKPFRFKANEEQTAFYENIWYRNLVLKARQLGFTTFIDLLLLDQCLFNPNFTAGIIAHSLEDATKIFRNKVLYPFEHLPKDLRDRVGLKKQSAAELIFGNGSSISVGTSMRSGTLQALHVSEFGKICRKYPERAQEIISGSFETIALGNMIFVESTAEGAEGPFYDFCDEALKRQAERLDDTDLDFRLHFFPWYTKEKYQMDPRGVLIEPLDRKYFAKLASEGIQLTDAQKAWYVKKKVTLKGNMLREYPATPKEAFEQTIEGAIYGEEMTWLRTNERLTVVPFAPGYPVNTFWDLGTNDTTAIWVHQRIGAQDRFIRYIEEANQGMKYFYNWLEDLRGENKLTWGKHFLPHDADNDLQGEVVETRVTILERLGMKNIQVVPRVADVKVGIDLTKDALKTAWIDKEHCSDGIKALDHYQREWDERLGRWRDHPLHNWASNGADAIRQWAQGYEQSTGAMYAHAKPTARRRSWRAA